jgi:hypothetical protein
LLILSNPASTAVCVVKIFSARVTACASWEGQPGALNVSASSLKNGECSVSFVEMTNLGLRAEFLHQLPANNPEEALV